MPVGSFLDDLKQYVGFTSASSATLRALHPTASPHFVAIVDDFYAVIEAHAGARAAITGGTAQIERLKKTLVEWLGELLLGPHDQAYLERRARIGRVHVRIELPQEYMFTAMDRIRLRLHDIAIRALAHDAAALSATTAALHQILDIELAIMLETYREDLLAKNRSAERLATIGQFAAGIGHELRNPLGVIESSQYLLRTHLAEAGPPGEKVQRHLDRIEAEVKRSTKIIADLEDLARSRPPTRRSLDVRNLVDASRSAALLPATVVVEIKMPDALRAVADFDQMVRVLSNLFINASQAMDGRGEIQVAAVSDSAATRIRVSDTGPGVPSDLRLRIFDAMFTTKARGTGLGLALARRIAEGHGGTLELEPSEFGACFVLTIPDAGPARGPLS